MARLSIIAAIGKNRELGNNNALLWDIPEDMEFFRSKTKGHTVIMGRKTYDSIGKPLPNRLNIIITSQDDLLKTPADEQKIFVADLHAALKIAKQYEKEEIFIIGGASVYTQALPFADTLYITRVDAEFEADTFFPNYEERFTVISERKSISNGFKITFFELAKK